MHERNIPARYSLVQPIADRPEGRVHRATEAGGRMVRLVVSHADPTSALALRQAHTRLMRLAHPHLAEPVALAPAAGPCWLAVSEWVAPLAAPSPEAIAQLLPDWLAALAHMHAAGFVHGDLRPEVLGVSNGVAKLADAGRGWRIGAPGAAEGPFAAPETRSRTRVDGRTDLYMLGAVVAYWLTGEAPRPEGLVPSEAWPAPLVAVLDGLLEPMPARRFGSATEALKALGAPGGPDAPVRHTTPFVGRRAELATLLDVASAVADERQCRTLVVSGEPGIGKSRLMDELRQRLMNRGFAVAVASAGDRTDGGAFAVWASLLPAVAAMVDADVLAELAPVLSAVLPLQVAPASALEPRAARMRLFRAIASLIEAAGDGEGLALCLDDWHRADEGSRDLLVYLQRALPAVPVYLVLATEGTVDDGTDGLVLGRFGHQEVGALRDGLWGPGRPDGGAGVDLAMLDGHPALVEEAVLEAVGAGVMAGAGMGAGPRAQIAVPSTFQALWTRRLALSSPSARALASASAVAGAQAPMALLKAVSGLEDAVFLEALDELSGAGVLTGDAQGYSLAAAAAADAATDAGAPARHAEALAYWRVASQMGRSVPASVLAHHALEAGDAHAGAYYALAAAKEAHKLFALSEAAHLIARGLVCLAAVADAPAAWRLEYEAVQGDHQRYSGKGAEAERHYREALAYAVSQPPHRVPELKTSLGIALGLQARSSDAEATFKEALAHPALMEPARARVVTALARLYVRLGRNEEAADACRDALAIDGAPDLYRGEALGLLGLVCVTTESPRPAEGLRHLAEARALAEAAGDRLALNNVVMLAGNARLALGQLPEARTEFERYSLLCQELGLADEAACATLNLAQVALEQGRLAEAWERATLGATAAEATGNRIYVAYGKVFSAVAACHLGRLHEADAAFAEGLRIADELKSEHLALQVLLAHLEGAIFLGRLGKAEELGLAIARRQADAGIHEFAGRHALLMGHLYELAGEIEEAIVHFERARTLAAGTDSATLLAGALLGRAMVALRAGQFAVARDRADDARALGESAGAELCELQSLLVLGRAELALGAVETARGHFLAADVLASRMASPHWQALVWAGMSQLGDEEAALRPKAGVFLQFYLQQLPPRARQEFLHWPERREAVERLAPRPSEAGGTEA